MAKENESKSLLGKIWRIKWWLLSIFTVLFLLFALFFPLNNYYVELPGGAFDTKEVLTVDKKADDSKGSYNFCGGGSNQGDFGPHALCSA